MARWTAKRTDDDPPVSDGLSSRSGAAITSCSKTAGTPPAHGRGSRRCGKRCGSAGLGKMLTGCGVGAARRIGREHPLARIFNFTATHVEAPGLKQTAEDYPCETLARVARDSRQVHAADALPCVPYLAAE